MCKLSLAQHQAPISMLVSFGTMRNPTFSAIDMVGGGGKKPDMFSCSSVRGVKSTLRFAAMLAPVGESGGNKASHRSSRQAGIRSELFTDEGILLTRPRQ